MCNIGNIRAYCTISCARDSRVNAAMKLYSYILLHIGVTSFNSPGIWNHVKHTYTTCMFERVWHLVLHDFWTIYANVMLASRQIRYSRNLELQWRSCTWVDMTHWPYNLELHLVSGAFAESWFMFSLGLAGNPSPDSWFKWYVQRMWIIRIWIIYIYIYIYIYIIYSYDLHTNTFATPKQHAYT
jgi:hypothetical protein